MLNNLYSVLIIWALAISSAHAQTYVRSYAYQASELDSKVSARTAALGLVRHMLLSELGTHVNSTTTIKKTSDGRNVSKLEITALTGGIIKTEILKETWDGKQYYAEVSMTADPEEIARKLQAQYKSKNVGKPIYVTKQDSATISPRSLVEPGNKVALLARHDVSQRSYSNKDEVTRLMMNTIWDEAKKLLPDNTIITTVSDFDVTEELLWESQDGKRSRYICSLYETDYVLAAIVEDHDGTAGYSRDMDMYIYNCNQNELERSKVRPTHDSDGEYSRENSIKKEFRRFLKGYMRDIG